MPNALRKPRYFQFVSFKKRKNSFLFEITTEGQEFLHIIEKMENIRSKIDMEEKLPFEKEERKVVVKKEASTNPEWGCKPEERPVEKLIQYGIANLNKPAGPR